MFRKFHKKENLKTKVMHVAIPMQEIKITLFATLKERKIHIFVLVKHA